MSDKNILHNFLLVLILSFTWQNIFAQKIVFGQITDGQTLQPLDGASVILENSNIGTISNHIGMFRNFHQKAVGGLKYNIWGTKVVI